VTAFVDVNGLNASLAYGMVKAGLPMAYRAGYLDLGRHIVQANASLWQANGSSWRDLIEPDAGSEDWLEWPTDGRADVVVGVPPCAGFSHLTGRGNSMIADKVQKANAAHPINACMWATVRYAARLKPRVVMFESVADAYRLGRGLMQELRAELETITGRRYNLTHWLHDGVTMGAPTSRLRYLFVATRGRQPFAVRPVDSYAVKRATPLDDAIDDLATQPLQVGKQKILRPDLAGPWARRLRRRNLKVDGHHQPPTNVWERRVEETLAQLALAGDRWYEGESMGEVLARLYAHSPGYAAQALMSEERAERMAAQGFSFGTFQIWREVGALPCKLITGGGSWSHVHPHQPRNLTFREMARVQGWPDALDIDYDVAEFGKEKLSAVWGKAVGCKVAEHAGRELAEYLEADVAGKTVGERVGEREWVIDELDHARRLRRQTLLERRAWRSRLPGRSAG